MGREKKVDESTCITITFELLKKRLKKRNTLLKTYLKHIYSLNGEPETRRSSRPSVTKEEPNPKFQKKMKCTNNKPTAGIKLCLTLIFLLCTATVEAVIPVPDCDPLFRNIRSKGLRKVVDDWIAGGTKRDTVETTYGLIQDWDTSRVTSMHYLFYYKTTFDADLSKWNVANVTSMAFSTCHFPLSSTPLSTTFKPAFLVFPLSLSLLECSFTF